MFVQISSQGHVLLLLYVDDMIVMGEDTAGIANTQIPLSSVLDERPWSFTVLFRIGDSAGDSYFPAEIHL